MIYLDFLQTPLPFINLLSHELVSKPFPPNPNLVANITKLLMLNRCHLCHSRGVYLHGSYGH